MRRCMNLAGLAPRSGRSPAAPALTAQVQPFLSEAAATPSASSPRPRPPVRALLSLRGPRPQPPAPHRRPPQTIKEHKRAGHCGTAGPTGGRRAGHCGTAGPTGGRRAGHCGTAGPTGGISVSAAPGSARYKLSGPWPPCGLEAASDPPGARCLVTGGAQALRPSERRRRQRRHHDRQLLPEGAHRQGGARRHHDRHPLPEGAHCLHDEDGRPLTGGCAFTLKRTRATVPDLSWSRSLPGRFLGGGIRLPPGDSSPPSFCGFPGFPWISGGPNFLGSSETSPKSTATIICGRRGGVVESEFLSQCFSPRESQPNPQWLMGTSIRTEAASVLGSYPETALIVDRVDGFLSAVICGSRGIILPRRYAP